jgi:hypothetical protein
MAPDGKVGHDAFAVIRETIREMNKIAIGRVVLTNGEHIIALEPMEKWLVGTLLRYPYQVRNEQEYFDEIQDVKVTKDMLDLARRRWPISSSRARQHSTTRNCALSSGRKSQPPNSRALMRVPVVLSRSTFSTVLHVRIGAKPFVRGSSMARILLQPPSAVSGEPNHESGLYRCDVSNSVAARSRTE